MKKTTLAITISAALISTRANGQQTINLEDLNGQNGVTINGIEPNDQSGRSVSGAGDINDDGVDDIIIGANLADPGSDNEGESYVVFGQTSEFPATVNLADLNGSNGFVLNGIDVNDYSGFAVSDAGDINGDGIADVVIGAYQASPGGNGSGESYVVFGRATAFPAAINLADLDGANGFVVNGINENDISGVTVGGAGDVNGDGIDDLLIGAHNANLGMGREGESYVVFGSSSPFNASLELSNLNGSNGFAITGIIESGSFGFSVDGAGDFNGDGIDDIVIGAPSASLISSGEGEAYVVFGRSTAFPANINLADLNGGNGFVFSGTNTYDFTGNSVGVAGDVNSDGIDDVVIVAPGASGGSNDKGEAYIIFGRTSGFPANINRTDINGINGFVISGVAGIGAAGDSVRTAGDINGDGIDDVMFGAAYASPRGSFEGATYVVFGRATGFAASFSVSDLNGRNGFVINGIDAADLSGGSATSAGDFNGDGIDDLIIGARYADPGTDSEGESYVVFGNAAPRRVGGPTALLLDELEDDANPAGSQLDLALADNYLDVDPLGGLAIIGVGDNSAQGRWQSSPDGASWQDLPSPLSDSSALVLDSQSWLRFVPAPDFSGQPAPLLARLWDGRWRESGTGIDITSAIGALGGFSSDDQLLNVTLNITGINDPPILTAEDPPGFGVNAGPILITPWASVNAGAPNEEGQGVTLFVSDVTNPDLFAVSPAVDSSGNLTFSPAPEAIGSSNFTVLAVDDGGVADGGQDTSQPQTFLITIRADALFANGFE